MQNASYINGDNGLITDMRVKAVLMYVSLAMMLILLTNCASLVNVPNRPVTMAFDMKSSVVRKAGERVLIKRKFILDPWRSDSDYLRTEWLRDGPYRSMVEARIKPVTKGTSEFAVNLIFQKKKLWRESWEPVDRIDKKAYEVFMNDVLIECYRVLYDNQ